MQKIFDDGILEATLYPDKGWVFCRWLQNKRGKLQKKLIRDILVVEKLIRHKGWLGWFTLSECDHKEFQRLLQKFGCEAAQIEDGYQYFIKRMVV